MNPEVDLSNCDREPIHVPGAIQPHGVLLSVEEPTLVVRQVSETSSDLLGMPPERLLDRPLSTIFDAPSLDRVRDHLAAEDVGMEPAISVAAGGRRFQARAHRHAGATIIELEPSGEADEAVDVDGTVPRALAEIQSAADLQTLHETAVAGIRRVTGFDRVLLYRFHEDAHGEVIAEVKAPDQEPYLGLRFPASDIPSQARELYRLNPVRVIADATYRPAPLVPSHRPDTGAPLDLSFAILRSVSPIHREYMRNMGVRASMSLSLLHHGELWGLLSCHHRSPRQVRPRLRLACEVLARTVALQNAALMSFRENTRRDALLDRVEALAREVERFGGASVDALAGHERALAELLEATGVAVATEDGWSTGGDVPSSSVLESLREQVRARASEGLYQTNALSKEWDRGAEVAEVASGVLAIVLPGMGREVLWFRPETIRTVEWAGDPGKPVEEGESGRLHPRSSFSLWREEVRGTARAWEPAERRAALELRRRLVEADLARQLQRAEDAVRGRDDVMAVVSHDLRNPLMAAGTGLDLLETRLSGSSSLERPSGHQKVVDQVRRALVAMEKLIDDLVDRAALDAGELQVRPSVRPPGPVIEEAVAATEPEARRKGIRLETTVDETPPAAIDASRISQALANLMSNAVRHTPSGGTVRVSLSSAGDEATVTVSDTGPGLPRGDPDRLFERSWQGAEGRGRSGLGLYIARGIVEAHGGRIWAEEGRGAGATFRFTLPLA